jgi:hypothetical protein
MKAVESEKVPFVSAGLTVLLLVLAVCVKIHVIRVLWDALKPEPPSGVDALEAAWDDGPEPLSPEDGPIPP